MRMNNSDSCITITAKQLIDSIQEEELAKTYVNMVTRDSLEESQKL